MSIEKTARALMAAMKQKEPPKPYDVTATVTRVEDDIVWVHIPGGVDETPVKKTIAASEGDEVQVRVGGGSAWLTGNASAPPTDDAAANKADAKASEALEEIEILNRIKVSWAEIQKAIIEFLELYGLMTVYENSALRAIGGHIGYGSAPSGIGNGLALISRTPDDAWPEAPVLEGASVIQLGEEALYLANNYWGASLPIWIDGGVDVNPDNYPLFVKIGPTGITIYANGERAFFGTDPNPPFDTANWFKGKSVFDHIEAPEIYYSPGDTFAMSSYAPLAGNVTASSKTIYINVPVDKLLDNISSISVTSLKGGIRAVNGNYVNGVTDGNEWVGLSGITITAEKASARMVRVTITSTSAFTSGGATLTNNTPLVLNGTVSLAFS